MDEWRGVMRTAIFTAGYLIAKAICKSIDKDFADLPTHIFITVVIFLIVYMDVSEFKEQRDIRNLQKVNEIKKINLESNNKEL